MPMPMPMPMPGLATSSPQREWQIQTGLEPATLRDKIDCARLSASTAENCGDLLKPTGHIRISCRALSLFVIHFRGQSRGADHTLRLTRSSATNGETARFRDIYNRIRPHQSLGDRTPRQAYLGNT
jgi:transposase InsO family protein